MPLNLHPTGIISSVIPKFVGQFYFVVLLPLLILMLLTHCQSKPKNETDPQLTHLGDTAIVTSQLDTAQIINHLNHKIGFVNRHKHEAQITIDSAQFQNADSVEDNGDYSNLNQIDSIFYLNDSLKLVISTTHTEIQFGTSVTKTEFYYAHNQLFFQFKHEITERPDDAELTGVVETQFYIHNGIILKCLSRRVNHPNIDTALNSVKRIAFITCQ